jgi:hypothetical protein
MYNLTDDLTDTTSCVMAMNHTIDWDAPIINHISYNEIVKLAKQIIVGVDSEETLEYINNKN